MNSYYKCVRYSYWEIDHFKAPDQTPLNLTPPAVSSPLKRSVSEIVFYS
jgi:hypothetical protein